MDNRNRQVLLKRRPTGAPTAGRFRRSADAPLPDPGAGEVLVRGIYLSLDPYMRGRISGVRSYAKPTEIGAVIEGRVVGEVARSRDPVFREGDYVLGGYGWQLYSAVPGRGLPQARSGRGAALHCTRRPRHAGAHRLCRLERDRPAAARRDRASCRPPRVPSARSRANSPSAGGARVVGIAGGADKCRYVEAELGFDACIDHRAADLGAALDRACPKGIDVYWENVGGAVQQAVFPRLNDFGRMVMCGMVAEYNDVEPRPGPNLTSAVRRRLKIQGFIVSDQWQRFAEYRAMAAPLVKSGELKYREDIVDGLDRAPEAFIGLLQGRNFGKLVVKLGDDPTRR